MTMKKSSKKDLTILSQTEVVTLVVFLLGGDQRAIDTEDIAIRAHQLAPGRFSWRKYPEQINLELVRVYLSDAKKPDKGKTLIGSGRTGWRLTQRGLKWAEATSHKSKNLQTSRTRAQSRSGSIDEQRWRRERVRLQSTDAWRAWVNGERDIPFGNAKEVFRIDSYAKGDLREAKLTRVTSLFSDDDELKPFLEHLVDILNRGSAT